MLVEQVHHAGNGFVLPDAQQIRAAPNGQGGQFCKRGVPKKLDVQIGKDCDDFGVLNAHGAWDALLPAKPSVHCWRGLRCRRRWSGWRPEDALRAVKTRCFPAWSGNNAHSYVRPREWHWPELRW